MNSGDYTYIWQATDWPNWRYDLTALAQRLSDVSQAQGRLLGRLSSVGLALREQASLLTLTDDVLKTSEIEGEHLNAGSVRSSIARHLGIDIGALLPADRHIDGIVKLILDATGNAHLPVTQTRLFNWHAALFPTGQLGLSNTHVGQWRDDQNGPMQVVSGPIGRQKIHFEAQPANRLNAELEAFLNGSTSHLTNLHCSKRGWPICGLSLCILLTTETVVSHVP